MPKISSIIRSISPITWSFLVFGLLLQLIVFLFSPQSPLALCSGMLGICSVVLGAQGNILTFLFGFAQVITYTYLCCLERFYAEIAINVYYFFTMIYGAYCWFKRLSNNTLQVSTRLLPRNIFPWLSLAIIIVSMLVGWGLHLYTNDPQPYMDAFTTVPAIVAQILMVLAYREQWFLWLAVDVLAVIMWFRAENYCMAAQYAFWCANCIYGYLQWTKSLGTNS